MSLGERMFGALWRSWRGRALRRHARGGVEVTLAALEGRLRTLAALVAGRFVELRPTEPAAAGAGERTLWLPRSVRGPTGTPGEMPADAPGEAPAAAQRDYLARTVIAARALSLGLPERARQLRAEDLPLATALATAIVERSLARDLPGALPLLHVALRARAAELVDVACPDGKGLLALRLIAGHADVETVVDACGEARTRWAQRQLAGSTPEPADLVAAVRAALACYPGAARELIEASTPEAWLPGTLRPDGAAHQAGSAAPPRPSEAPPDALPKGSERAGVSRPDIEEVVAGKEKDGDNPLAHVFEKLFTAEEYQGGNRRTDGADELDEHGDALDELEVRQVMRTAEAANSLYRADLDLAPTPVDLVEDGTGGNATGIAYDEWDTERRAYRKAWCTVHTEIPAPETGDHHVRLRRRHARTIDALLQQFVRLQRKRRPRPRQPVGADIDIDAVVDRHGQRRAAGSHPDAEERLYVARRRPDIDLSVLVLVDASMSSDSWTGGRRVLDVTLSATTVLGEVFDRLGLPFAIGAFYSNSRRDCRYLRVKDQRQPWATAARRLVAIRPSGYTRIGPALRHATSLLDAAPTRRRLLLLVSDGKPTDYDAYEGRHGIADVRQALREAGERGITTFGLAVEATARHYLPRMFGAGGYEILTDPDLLPQAAAAICQRVARR